MAMTRLPEKFYAHVTDYYRDQVRRRDIIKPMPSMEEQLAWFNKEFPEADWVAGSYNQIIPEFKSPELETFFRLKWE